MNSKFEVISAGLETTHASDALMSLFDFDTTSMRYPLNIAMSISISIFSKQASKYKNVHFYVAINVNNLPLVSIFFFV